MQNPEVERGRVFARRLLLLGGLQAGLFAALGARLYKLQVSDAAFYKLQAEDNRISQRLLMPARGRILDRTGKPLADNTPLYRVTVVREHVDDLDATLDRLAALIDLPDHERERVIDAAKARRGFVPITVRDDLRWEEVAKLAVRTPHLPGVTLDGGLYRDYPYGNELAHILGYVGPVSEREQEADDDPFLRLPDLRIGKNGVEKQYDKALRGRAGLMQMEVNAYGREIRELARKPGTTGNNVTLSLDLDLQRYCHRRLASELSASAVVLDVHTGAVLALASVPSFEPSKFDNGLSHAQWNEWRDDPRAPLVNKAVSGTYPPGSTFKMLTGLAALEAGAIDANTPFFCRGVLSMGRARFHCWRAGGHGTLSVVQALAQSCDVFFYEAAKRIGVDAIASMANRFGLGSVTGIDLPAERAGLMPTEAWKQAALGQPWQKGETVVIAIGQGYVSATPLQLAVMTARLANGGFAVTPWLVQPERSPDDPLVLPPSLGIVPLHLDIVREGMFEVVNGRRGTARKVQLDREGAQMAGKTGTSQVKRITRAERAAGLHKRKDKPWKDRHHALFVGFAPYDAPRYAVAVVVEHGGSGSAAAAPIAKDIMNKTLDLNPSGPLLNAAAAPRREAG